MSDDPKFGPDFSKKRMEQEKKKLEKIAKKLDQIPTSDLYQFMAEAINKKKNRFGVPFPHKYYLVEMSPWIKKVLRQDNGTVYYCDDEAVVDSILGFCVGISDEFVDYKFTHRQAVECMKFWKSMTKALAAEPALVMEKSEDGLCFHRLDFDCVKTEAELDTQKLLPFMELIDRCTNKLPLCAFIGSLFFPNSDREQYVYIHGDGQNGKSSLVRWIHRLMGPAFHADDPNIGQSQFWTESFVGKRLVVFPDCNTPTFPLSGKFKTLTGSDPVRIEEKNKRAYTTQLQCKFMFLSNEKLLISSKKADQRRAIYVHMDQFTQSELPTHIYDEMLWIARKDFLSFCKLSYLDRVNNHGPIPVDKSGEDLADDYEESYEAFFDTNFLKPAVPMEIPKDGNFDHFTYRFTPRDLQAAFKNNDVRNSREQSKIKDWMFRRHGITKKQARSGSEKGCRFYLGAKRV